MSDPLLDDSDLTLIINKEKIKTPDQSSTTEIKEINISKEDPNPFSINSSNPIINSFEKTEPPVVPSVALGTDNSYVSTDQVPSINVESFNPSSSSSSYQDISSNSSSKEYDYERERTEKANLLNKFDKLRRMGTHIPQEFNFSSDLQAMQQEYNKIKNQRELENSIKFQRKMLMACITGVEFLNNRFDPFDVKLTGWSESIHENINDYNDVFEELHEKYHTKTKMAPELKLMFMVGGSAFMFHLTNSMFKSQLPGLGDIMKQNPDLMKQFASAAMGSMGGPDMSSMFMGPSTSSSNPGPSSQPTMNNPSKKSKTFSPPTGIDELLSSLNSSESGNSTDNVTLNMN
jgi:hypothetical protein